MSPDEGHVFHNRLTHSLKVAQVGRRIAEMLLERKRPAADGVGGIDPDVVEAACLAHDLGHPPFGHIAEEELDRLMVGKGQVAEGFDGNAQSFRIVNHLAFRCADYDGLNLTRATLQAVLKYPWQRSTSGKEHYKWGTYSTEKSAFEFARALAPMADRKKSAEAEIMDWADDITYAVHDVCDFYRAGLIPLDRLTGKDGPALQERKRFYEGIFQREKFLPYQRPDLEETFEKFVKLMPFTDPYAGTNRQRAEVRNFSGGLISQYVREGLELSGKLERDVPRVRLDSRFEKQVILLKQLTWHYVILRPSLATQQHGQRTVIRSLFRIFLEAANDLTRRTLFPYAFQDMLDQATSHRERARIVCDYIAAMTEKQAMSLHLKLTGTQPGSGLR